MKKAAVVIASFMMATSLYSQNSKLIDTGVSDSADEFTERITEPLEPFEPQAAQASQYSAANGGAPAGDVELAGNVLAGSLDISTERLTLPLKPFVNKEKTPTFITWSGFIKLDNFWDSRQVQQSINGLSIDFPLPRVLDRVGKDINAQGLFNSLAVQTLLRGSIQGPEVLGAKTAAAVEGDWIGSIALTGQENVIPGSILGLFRLRHALANFDWPNVDLLFGQYWHPLFVPVCTPATLAFDGGTPVAINVRNPQVRVTGHSDPTKDFHWAILGAMFSEGISDFTDGPAGFSPVYVKDGVMPMLGGRIDLTWKRHYFGAGASVMRIKPRLVSNNDFKVNETLFSSRGTVFAALNWKYFTVRTKFNVGQNMTNLDMLGGYAVSTIDPVTDERTYANLTTASYWIEASVMNSMVEPGFYLGISKNLGSNKPIITRLINPDGTEERTVYGVGTDIDTLWLIIPRVRLNFKNVTFGFELQFTRAAFGTIDPCNGRVFNTDPVTDVRALFIGYYFF